MAEKAESGQASVEELRGQIMARLPDLDLQTLWELDAYLSYVKSLDSDTASPCEEG